MKGSYSFRFLFFRFAARSQDNYENRFMVINPGTKKYDCRVAQQYTVQWTKETEKMFLHIMRGFMKHSRSLQKSHPVFEWVGFIFSTQLCAGYGYQVVGFAYRPV